MNARKFRENQIVLILSISGLDVFVYKSVFDLDVTIIQSRNMNFVGKPLLMSQITLLFILHTQKTIPFICSFLSFVSFESNKEIKGKIFYACISNKEI